MHKVLANTISNDDLNYLEQVFDSYPHVVTNGMEKVLLPLGDDKFLSWTTEVIEQRVGIRDPYVIVGDNFYKHGHSYFPHCDAVENSAWLNIVIPIRQWQKFGQQKFIVFDQMWSGKNATWLGSYELKGDFDSNKKRSDRPCDGEYFFGGTKEDLPNSIWQHMEQKHFTRDYFYSMGGTAYDWSPGSIIVFDSQHIHATGRMQSVYKLGLSIRIAYP